MAVASRGITDELIFQSNSGMQYACTQFRELLKIKTLVLRSMGRRANCWGNAVAESFFKTLKTECVYHQKYNTINEAKLSVF